MTPEELQAWINSLPGKTFQQKLNLAQDLADAYNIDLFGVNTQFVPETYVPQLDAVARTWGSDPVYGAIFTAIDNGMSPTQAVQAAKESPDLKDYFPATGGMYEDAVSVAGDYATERLQNQFAEQQFNAQQANKQAIFEGKQPLGLSGEAASMYDVVGQPSLDRLMNMYMEGVNRYRPSLGTTDLSVTPFSGVPEDQAAGRTRFGIGPDGVSFRFGVPRPGLPNIPELSPTNVARGVLGVAGGMVPRTAAALGPGLVRGIRGMFGGDDEDMGEVDRSGGESAASIRARQEYTKSRTGAAQAEKKAASSSMMANNPQFKKFVEDRVREMAYRSIAGMAATPVRSPRDQQAAARLAALQQFSNLG
jgi:hypothetical protein